MIEQIILESNSLDGHGHDDGQNEDFNQLSVENKCAICLSDIVNLSLTDVCHHEYCFDCINQWSTHYNMCPLCLQVYDNIICDGVGDQKFKKIPVKHIKADRRQMSKDLHFIRFNQIGIRIEAVIRELNRNKHLIEVTKCRTNQMNNDLIFLSFHSEELERKKSCLKLEENSSWRFLFVCCTSDTKVDKLIEEIDLAEEQTFQRIRSIREEKQRLESESQTIVNKIEEIVKELERLRLIVNHLNQSFILDFNSV